MWACVRARPRVCVCVCCEDKPRENGNTLKDVRSEKKDKVIVKKTFSFINCRRPICCLNGFRPNRFTIEKHH